MIKERIYLTDITLHTRGYRQTCNFSKVAQKGRMYSPLPEDHLKNLDTEKRTTRLSLNFPQDLQERLDKGEVELMMPEGGLFIYAGRDIWEFITKQNEQRRRQLIHSSRVWHSK